MRRILTLTFITLALTITSFKSKEDTLCYINYSGVDSQGCTTSVVGTYDCNSPNPISTFTGTITMGGGYECIHVELDAMTANPAGTGWEVPSGADVAFYTDSNDDFCGATTLIFIGNNQAAVDELNFISKSILAEFQSDIGC